MNMVDLLVYVSLGAPRAEAELKGAELTGGLDHILK